MALTPSPRPPAEGSPAAASRTHQGRTEDGFLQLTLFDEVAPATAARGREPSHDAQGPRADPLPTEGKGKAGRDADPFPPPPLFLLPGEQVRKSLQKCVEYLVQHEGRGRSEGFEQFLFLLCAKLYEERNPGLARRFCAEEQEARADGGCAAIRERIVPLFNEVKEAVPSVFADEDCLTLSDQAIAFVVTALGRHCLSATDLDPFGVAYQQWTSAAARYDRGQFFTPLGAAFFAVCLLDPLERERALDYACGCGAFLAALYAYRASQLGLEFAEGVPTDLSRREKAPEGEALARLARYMQTQVFGADLDAFLADIARKRMALAHGAPAHIYRLDSLAFPDEANLTLADIPLGSLDCVISNPPFGVKITDEALLRRYELARIWNRQGDGGFRREERLSKRVFSEVLFLERALDWLKPGGRLALVVPDGVLSEPSTTYARDWLLRRAVLSAVVSLPDETFYVESRTHTKTSVLLMRKKTDVELQVAVGGDWNYSVFMAIAEKVGVDSRGRTLYRRGPDGEEIRYQGRRLVDNDLPIVLTRYRQFRQSPHISPPPA